MVWVVAGIFDDSINCLGEGGNEKSYGIAGYFGSNLLVDARYVHFVDLMGAHV